MANLPVDKPEFWKDRLAKAILHGCIHHSVYIVSSDVWQSIQETHRNLLQDLLYQNQKVLDAGCGYGALVEILPSWFNAQNYIGIDSSPDLIDKAKQLYPNFSFLQEDIRKLPFGDKEFDICVVRSLEGTIKDNLGFEVWQCMEEELFRVSRRVLLLSYTNPSVYTSIDPHNPERDSLNYVEHPYGRLAYRLGLGNVCEVYDLFVDREHRRKGIGTSLLTTVLSKGFNTVYGFARVDNVPVHNLQKKLGYKHHLVPGLYGGQDGYFAYWNRTTNTEKIARD